jgi:hypothetical protein
MQKQTLTNHSTFFCVIGKQKDHDTENSDIAWLSIDIISTNWRRDLMLFENNNRVLDQEVKSVGRAFLIRQQLIIKEIKKKKEGRILSVLD